jgi:phosphatidylglycerophosphate synthase
VRSAARANPGSLRSARQPPAWLPNAISFARIALIPAFVGFAEACQTAAQAGYREERLRALAAATLIVIGLSDVVDGHLARRHGLGTALGAWLDAVADKLVQIVVVAYFTLRSGPAFAPLPDWFLALLILRDAVIIAGSLVVRRRRGRVDVQHRAHGKFVSLLLFVLILAITLGLPSGAATAGALLVTAVAVPSTLGYVRYGFVQWRSGDAGAR